MRTTWILAFALFCAPVHGFAETAAPTPLTSQVLAAILAQPMDAGCGAIAQSAPPPAAMSMSTSQTKALCTATATCESGTGSCQSNVSGTSCSAFDRSCPSEQGHVTCDGVTTWCSTSCCNSGTPRQRNCCTCAETGDCEACFICAHGFLSPDVC